MQSAATQLPLDTRRKAKFLYWIGWRVTEIAQAIGENEKTVHSWKSRDEWDRADNVERIGGVLDEPLRRGRARPASTSLGVSRLEP
ncbi:terminase gpP N-terminus-related DNA-binding protein [Xanthomonas citri]|uniref:terminase gpP N-terminus-related DNA-binding protein n=1 Tax=Xanthomonas citri TaxID=346 RepID=UPI003CC82358